MTTQNTMGKYKELITELGKLSFGIVKLIGAIALLVFSIKYLFS